MTMVLIPPQEFTLRADSKDDNRIDLAAEKKRDEDQADASEQTWHQRESKHDKDKQHRQMKQQKKKLEPSLKWKALGVEEYNESV